MALEVFHLENHFLNDPLIWLLAVFVDLNELLYDLLDFFDEFFIDIIQGPILTQLWLT